MANKLPAKGPSKGKGGRSDQWIVAGIILALIAIVLFLWGPLRTYRRGGEKTPVHAKKSEQEQRKQTAADQAARKESEKAARIAIVIDDLGQDIKQAQDVISLHARITLSVMPGLPQSRNIAMLARQNGREVLLHLPMEPKDRNNRPIPRGTLRSDMTPGEFMAAIVEDVASVPGAKGVNNHEGSALTENREAMKFLMAELRVRNLFFLDSRTNPKSIAYSTAKEFGLKAANRDVFLDNEFNNRAYIRGQLEELVRLARKHGSAIAIGHPHPATIDELRSWVRTMDDQNLEIVPVSRMVN